MAKPKVYKCGFRHCQHESCEVSQEEAVQVGRRYFHSDCAEIYYNMQEIQRLYREKISNTVVMPQLLSVINNIVFTKHIESSYLLFALKFAINTKISIRSPYSLHYLVDRYQVKEAWKKKQSQKVRAVKFEAAPQKAPTFSFAASKQTKDIGDLFG